MSSPTVPTYTYTSREWMEAVGSVEGIDLRLDDDFNDTVSATEEAYLTEDTIYSATDWCNFYLAVHYTPAKLCTSNWVWRCCTIVALRMLCLRRFETVPESLMMQYEEVIEMMQMVQKGTAQVPLIAQRSKKRQLAFANVEVDFRYNSRRVRVQRNNSTDRATRYDQRLSRWDLYTLELF